MTETRQVVSRPEAPDTFQTQRLRGRRVADTDLPYVIATDTDWQIQKTLFGVISTAEESKGRLERWLQIWQENGFGFWIFLDSANNEVGHAGLFPSRHDPELVELGYAFKPQYWNLGYATEVSKAILRIGFQTLGLPRIIAVSQPENLPSRHVMEKCGMAYDGEFLAGGKTPSVRYVAEREAWMSRFRN